ncbi:hypothetical protein Tco_0336655 [Tanacetum coccineum]
MGWGTAVKASRDCMKREGLTDEGQRGDVIYIGWLGVGDVGLESADVPDMERDEEVSLCTGPASNKPIRCHDCGRDVTHQDEKF